MKGYLNELWTNPEFFVNSVKAGLASIAAGAGAFIAVPVGRTLTEKLVAAALIALAGGTASLPSAKGK